MGSLSLPVSAARPMVEPADLVRRFHRAQMQRARAIAEETVLDGGTWLHNADLQPLADANCVLDAAIDPGGTAAQLVAEVERLAAGCPVRAWTLSPSLPAERTRPLADHLIQSGWTPLPWDVYHLERRGVPIEPTQDLSIIPARAAYGRFRSLAQYHLGDRGAEAAVLALDDPHLDAWLALRDGRPIATLSLLNDGETGTVADLYVTPDERGRGVAAQMLARALEASGRSTHRHVLAGLRCRATGLFSAVGFRMIGQWVRYERTG